MYLAGKISECIDSGERIIRRDDGVAVGLQDVPNEIQHIAVVVYHQDIFIALNDKLLRLSHPLNDFPGGREIDSE